LTVPNSARSRCRSSRWTIRCSRLYANKRVARFPCQQAAW
jgi:hypothetical protein